jgi:GMP synthase (glutamine-hydrolysing)
MMARALGARVYPGGRKEIGWGPLALTEAGRASCLRLLAPEATAVLHWHGDTFDLPAGATLLASTDLYERQAFAWGRHALALQFHCEVTGKALERWFIGHACEIAGTAGVTVPDLRRDTARWGPLLEAHGPKTFDAWLRELSP